MAQGPYKIPRQEVFEELKNTPIVAVRSKGGGGDGGYQPNQLLTVELADEICARLSDGESLSQILKSPGMPHRWTIYEWIQNHSWFEQKYRKARANQIDTLVDQIPDIADDATNDFMERVRADGSVDSVVDSEHIRRSQIRIMARQWLAERIAPKKYGPKAEMALANPDGSKLAAPTQIILVAASPEDAKKLFEDEDKFSNGDVIDVEPNDG